MRPSPTPLPAFGPLAGVPARGHPPLLHAVPGQAGARGNECGELSVQVVGAILGAVHGQAGGGAHGGAAEPARECMGRRLSDRAHRSWEMRLVSTTHDFYAMR